jgi:hypothetical protein
MIQVLLVACCVFGCPALMGGMMWFMGRDHEGAKLEREVRRLNRVAARRRLAVAAASTLDEGANPPAAMNSPEGAATSQAQEPTALAAG